MKYQEPYPTIVFFAFIGMTLIGFVALVVQGSIALGGAYLVSIGYEHAADSAIALLLLAVFSLPHMERLRVRAGGMNGH